MDTTNPVTAGDRFETTMQHLFTKKGWARYLKEVAALEDAAADGNTWGPETDAAILARLVIDGLRKDAIKRHEGAK
jgi:hypothetical protein